jgi:Tfp pilus assembly protein PilF
MAQDRSKAASDALADDEAPQRSTSFARFIIDIVIIGGLLGGGVFFYNKHITTKNAVQKLSAEGRDLMKKDDLVSLREAEAKYKEILDIDEGNGKGTSGLAEVYFRMAMQGEDTLGKAKEYIAMAVDEGAETPSRYAVPAYIKIVEGNAAAAEAEVRQLLDSGIASPKLAHAYGWSLAEQGKFVEANRILRQAQDTDFSAVAFRLTLADVAHRQGQERAAVRHLDGATATNMNPNHYLAEAWEAALRLKNFGNLTDPAKSIEVLKAAEKEDKLSKKATGYLRWAEGELALALLNIDGALGSAEEALKIDPKFPPFVEFKARALTLARKRSQRNEGLKLYEQAIGLKPEYQGFKWALAELKSKAKDDGALALIDDLDKSFQGTKGPEFEIFRGEHYLRRGNLEKAKDHFTKAADLGDSAQILFGLAKVTFEEEKAKGNKADLDRVGEAFTQVAEKQNTYPELHEYLAEISLWNFVLDAAHTSYQTAEQQYKAAKRPIPEVFQFYDRVVDAFNDVKEKKIKGQAKEKAKEWRTKQQEYISSLLSEAG